MNANIEQYTQAVSLLKERATIAPSPSEADFLVTASSLVVFNTFDILTMGEGHPYLLVIDPIPHHIHDYDAGMYRLLMYRIEWDGRDEYYNQLKLSKANISLPELLDSNSISELSKSKLRKRISKYKEELSYDNHYYT